MGERMSKVADSATVEQTKLIWLRDVEREERTAGEKLRDLEAYLRLAHPDLLAFAERVWQDKTDALNWLGNPHAELDGAIPAAILDGEGGKGRVENVLAALEYGFPV